MAAWHLAQYNVASAIGPAESPEMAEFLALVPAVNAAAESCPDFVWRLKDDGVSTGNGRFQLSNLSVWKNVEALRAFTYRNAHAAVFRDRARWFVSNNRGNVLWWIHAGHQPDIAEGEQRLNHLRANGPSGEAFDFAHPFDPPTT